MVRIHKIEEIDKQRKDLQHQDHCGAGIGTTMEPNRSEQVNHWCKLEPAGDVRSSRWSLNQSSLGSWNNRSGPAEVTRSQV